MSSKFDYLVEHILSLSEADNFDEAKTEWYLESIYYDDEWSSCPCTQAIKEVCVIANRKTGHVTSVGNSCVKNFLGIDTGNMFSLMKKLIEDEDSVIGLKLIGYVEELGYIYNSEVEFLKSLAKNRKYGLSEKQNSWRSKIVRRILGNIQVKKT